MPEPVYLAPYDPSAQREVRIAFERIGSVFRVIAAFDDRDDDILPDRVPPASARRSAPC